MVSKLRAVKEVVWKITHVSNLKTPFLYKSKNITRKKPII